MSDVDSLLRAIKPRVASWISREIAAQATTQTNDHGRLIGLMDDDHLQYVHTITARSITAKHTFAPASPNAPFLLSANAQGQLVVGLAADTAVTAVTATNLTRSVIAGAGLSGGGVLNADRTLDVGAGTLITVGADTVGLSLGSAEYQVPLTGAYPFTPAWATASNNPGAAVAILRSDTSGRLSLVELDTDMIKDKSGANLTIKPWGDIILSPDGFDVLPNLNYTVNLGMLSKKYLTLHAAELWVETLVAQNTIATIGGRILVGPTTTLAADFVLSNGVNKCLNPGFETLGGGGVDVFANWTEQAGTGGVIWADYTYPKGGTKDCGIQRGTVDDCYIYQNLTVTPGATITFSFWTRGDGTNAGRFAVYDVTHAAWILAAYSTGVSGTTWTKTGTIFGVPAGCTSVSFYFWPPNVTSGWALFDEVYITDQFIQVKHNQMSVGDMVYLEAEGKVEWMQVCGGPYGSNPFAYGVFRDLDFSGMNDWYAGDAIFNTGTTGKGWIDLYSISSMRSGAMYGPTIQGVYRWGPGYSQTGEAWAIGNLNGLYGYSSTIFGVGLGFYGWSYAHVTIDNTNGIRFGRLDGAGGYHKNAQWAPDGTLTIGNRTDGKANVQITDTGIYLNQTDTVNTITLTTTGELTIGNGAAGSGVVYISTAGISIKSGTTTVISLDTSGNALFGLTGTSKANMYWNASNSRLEFRTNTTPKSYIATDGAFTIPMPSSWSRTSAVVFRDEANSFDCAVLEGYTNASQIGLQLWTYGQTAKSSSVSLGSYSLTTANASLSIQAANQSYSAQIAMIASSTDARITFDALTFFWEPVALINNTPEASNVSNHSVLYSINDSLYSVTPTAHRTSLGSVGQAGLLSGLFKYGAVSTWQFGYPGTSGIVDFGIYGYHLTAANCSYVTKASPGRLQITDFNGSTSKCYIALSGTNLNVYNWFSVGVWVKFDSTGNQAILCSGTTTVAYWLIVWNNKIEFGYYDSGGNPITFAPSPTIAANTWYFIGLTHGWANSTTYYYGIRINDTLTEYTGAGGAKNQMRAPAGNLDFGYSTRATLWLDGKIAAGLFMGYEVSDMTDYYENTRGYF